MNPDNGCRHRRRAAFFDVLLLLFAIAAFLFALLLPVLAFGSAREEMQLINAYEKGEIIRLHIIAPGNSPGEQRLKIQVRDAVLRRFGQLLQFSGAEDAAAAMDILLENLENIRLTAESCARENGYQGSVSAECGLLPLPKKLYGRVLLPQGNYFGLRITLGEGRGRNWWCVLFPELCLSLSQDDPLASPPGSGLPPLRWDSLRILQNWFLFSFDS